MTGSGVTDQSSMYVEGEDLPWPSVSWQGINISQGGCRGGAHQVVGRRRCCPRIVDVVDSGRRQRAWANAYELSSSVKRWHAGMVAQRPLDGQPP